MIIKKPYSQLTNRDLDILNILWNSENALTASAIAGSQDGLTINTVQAELRKLLKMDLIKIADIVYSGTVLCRSYLPTVTSKEFALAQFAEEFRQLQTEISTTSLVATLLEQETDDSKRTQEIEKLEELLQNYKNSSKK